MAQTSDTIQQKPQRDIETLHLVLRGAQATDSTDLFECFKDAQTMRYWDTLPHASVDVTQKWVDKMIQGENNGVTDFVICLKSPDANHASDAINHHDKAVMKVIGKVGIWQGNEIGFLLNRAYWGKGLAMEAVSVVLDLAFHFDNDSLSKSSISSNGNTVERREDVVADVDPRNVASLGILKKLGFEVYATKEKTFQVGDEWVDSVYLSLKRDTWMKVR